MKVAVGVIAVVLAGAWAWTTHARAVEEHALAEVAGRLAGRPVHVHCQSRLGRLVDVDANSGRVAYDASGHPRNTTDLKRYVCRALDRFRRAGHHPQLDCLLATDWSQWSFGRDAAGACALRAGPTAQAINTLTHESMHMHGWTDEATAQCYAIQADAWTVMRLGGTYAEGKAVASSILAMQPGMPSEYQSPQCRAGALDLHPETSGFPTESPAALG